jgi:hypothetical protein
MKHVVKVSHRLASIKAFSTVAGVEEEGFVALNGSELVAQAFDLGWGDEAWERLDLFESSAKPGLDTMFPNIETNIHLLVEVCLIWVFDSLKQT